MKKKGFTLVELLVVISIIALLIAILMPALSKVKTFAYQLLCGTNLSGLGKAMLLYAPEYQDEFPRAGTATSTWLNKIANWQAADRTVAFGGTPGAASVSSCFYLLIKYAEATPKMFACKSEGAVVWDAAKDGATTSDLTAFWDFGPSPLDNCSYSMHMPIGGSGYVFYLTSSSEGGSVVAADRNPFIPDASNNKKTFTDYNPAGTRDQIRAGNSSAHGSDGQNVMYLDAHVEFNKSSDVGISQDCIYTAWNGLPPTNSIRIGTAPLATTIVPRDRADSYLVSDGIATAGGGGGGGGGGGKGQFCFLPDTPVWTDGAFMQISKVTAGQNLGQNATAEKLSEHEATCEVRQVTLTSGNSINVVGDHRFMLSSGLWIGAEDLQSGMTLKTLNGTVGIQSVTTSSYTGKVYNINVNSSDQYMVGEDAVVVRDY